MKNSVVIVKTDGEIYKETINGKRLSLRYLQSKVGGYIQIVGAHLFNDITNDIMLVIDAEGKLKDKDYNVVATALYGNKNDCIVGDVVVCTTYSDTEEEDDVYPFDDERCSGVIRVITDLKQFLVQNGIKIVK